MVVYDATGNARSMTDPFQYVAHGGKLVFVGLVKTGICRIVKLIKGGKL